MKKSDQMVWFIAREKSDLDKLSDYPSPLENPSGSMGRIIASKVRDGGGEACLRASEIRMAIDTIDGLNAILDNFDLLDERTREPLLYHLLKKL